MTATISGLGSGIDIDTIVSQLVAVKQASLVTPLEDKLSTLEGKNSAVSTLKTKYTTLQSALQTFSNTIYNSSSDMWSKMSVSSSNDAFVTASASGNVSASNVEIMVEQIATSTTATSVRSLGVNSREAVLQAKYSDVANSQTTVGTFSMYLDNKQYQIEITDDDTIESIIGKIDEFSEGKIKADVTEDGNFVIEAVDKNSKLVLGSSSDTSNFESALKLYKAIDGYGFSSSYPVSTVNISVAMASSESGINGLKFFDESGNDAQNGTITINGIDIEIDNTTTLNELINKINNTGDIGVKASYDALNNKITLKAEKTGENNISLSETGTNLLNVLGLTEGEGENEKIATNSQVLGQNAIAYINGNKVISASNTITGESSGIANLSITVKKPTSDYSKNPDDDKKIDLTIERDNSQIISAVEKFVNAYNDVVSTTSDYTQTDGKIGYDSALNSILRQLRTITSTVSDVDGAYNMLAQIGIDASKDDTTKLTLDKDKLTKALNSNSDSVKFLLSDGKTNEADTGVLDGVLKQINNVLDLENGYFATKKTSFDSQIKTMNTRIERANERLLNYQTRIVNQFNRMDSLISNLNTQLSTFSSYFS